MQAILFDAPGNAEQLYLGSAEVPSIDENEILVDVKATALNRADLLQRQGMYPPPSGASTILGLEMSGVVSAVGTHVNKWKIGDRVFGLLPGGGYASKVKIHEDLAMAMNEEMTFEQGAAISEVFFTAFQGIEYLGQFKSGEALLIHAGASGVGTAAIQIAKAKQAGKIIVTASKGKHDICMSLGADVCIDYKTEDFAKVVDEVTNNKGVSLVIDFLGAPYFQRNMNVLDVEGTMVLFAFMGGFKIEELNIVPLLRKRIQIKGSTLRARSLDYKIKLKEDFWTWAQPLFASGQLRPIIDSVYSWKDVQEAHKYMEANKNRGKIILKMD